MGIEGEKIMNVRTLSIVCQELRASVESARGSIAYHRDKIIELNPLKVMTPEDIQARKLAGERVDHYQDIEAACLEMLEYLENIEVNMS